MSILYVYTVTVSLCVWESFIKEFYYYYFYYYWYAVTVSSSV